MVGGLDLGANTLFADSNGRGNGRPTASLTLVNHPVTGPIFSGPQQQPFVCKTPDAGALGFPQVDNQDGIGMRLSDPTLAADRLEQGLHGDHGRRLPLPHHRRERSSRCRPGRCPADVARRRRSTAAPCRTCSGASAARSTASSTRSRSSRRPATRPRRRTRRSGTAALIYTFDGGVAIGHNQGTVGGSHLYDLGLSKGYAIVHSSGTRTSTHYNLVLGAETAIMTKERFIEGYGVPLYTVGVGGSGGAIQQYVYAQRHPA